MRGTVGEAKVEAEARRTAIRRAWTGAMGTAAARPITTKARTEPLALALALALALLVLVLLTPAPTRTRRDRRWPRSMLTRCLRMQRARCGRGCSGRR